MVVRDDGAALIIGIGAPVAVVDVGADLIAVVVGVGAGVCTDAADDFAGYGLMFNPACAGDALMQAIASAAIDTENLNPKPMLKRISKPLKFISTQKNYTYKNTLKTFIYAHLKGQNHTVQHKTRPQ